MTNHILIVDDESAIRDMLRMSLESNGFMVSEANSAQQAQREIEHDKPDLLLLDWMMPGISGLEFTKRLSNTKENNDIGIIMVTAKDEEEDQIRALDVGADDYITKPFSTRELVSRINAVLRRLKNTSDDETADFISLGGISIDMASHRINIHDKEVDFSPTEFRLLHFFMTHPDRVFSRSQLLDQVWGENIYVEDRTVDVHIRRLRKILEEYNCDNYINTIRSVGYRFSISRSV
ncbi:MAG: phosphate regulon transcriptional regulator PhoB [Arenicella sp.]